MVAPVRGAELRRNRARNPRAVFTGEAFTTGVNGGAAWPALTYGIDAAAIPGVAHKSFARLSWSGNPSSVQWARFITGGDTIPATPGEKLSGRVKMRVSNGGNSVRIGIASYAGGSWKSEYFTGNVPAPAGQWVDLENLDYMVPSGTEGVRVFAQVTPTRRRNLILDPDMTSGWAGRWFGGSGATGNYSYLTGTTPDVAVNNRYVRKAWTTTGATGDTGFSPAVDRRPSVTAGKTYTFSAYLRPSVGGKTGRASLLWMDAAGAQVGPFGYGPTTSLASGVWTRMSVTAVAPAGAVSVVPVPDILNGGTDWKAGDSLDLWIPLLEEGSTLGAAFYGGRTNSANYSYAYEGAANASVSVESTLAASTTVDATAFSLQDSGGGYFDGDFPSTTAREYDYAGSANVSPSIEYDLLAAIQAVPDEDGRPWVGVTLRGFQPGDQVYTLWRTADGERMPVRGATRRPVSDSDYVIDYEPPLGRPVQYDLEVLSGADAGSLTAPAVTRVDSETGYISDPLDPTTYLPIHLSGLPGGEPTLISRALAQLEYGIDANIMRILGSSKPVAILGQRMAASGVDFSVLTDAAEQNTALRNLLKQAGLVLVRPLPSWGDGLPGICYMAADSVTEGRLNAEHGGVLTEWRMVGDTVAAPTARILIALFTYDDVAALFATYDQKQTVMAGKTYLDDLKDPLGANQAQRATLMSST